MGTLNDNSVKVAIPFENQDDDPLGDVVTEWVNSAFYEDLFRNACCPSGLCDAWKVSIGCLVTHLNDEHGWSREQIADWLDEVLA